MSNAKRVIVGLVVLVGVMGMMGCQEQVRVQAPSELVKAIKAGDVGLVETIIENGADVNAKDKRGFTPLHGAVYPCRNKEIVKILLENGANANANEKSVGTPMGRVFWQSGHSKYICDVAGDICKMLIKHGADVNPKTIGRTPLHEAVMNGCNDSVRLLILNGADVTARCNTRLSFMGPDILPTKVTPFELAVRGGSRDKEIVELLLIANKGKDINAIYKDGLTPLHVAAVFNSPSVVELLIESGADVNAKDKKGRTPLVWACANQQTVLAFYVEENIALLCKHGGTLGTELFDAIAVGNIDKVKTLIKENIDIVNAKDDVLELTPLLWAVNCGHKDITDILIDSGADINAKDKKGYTSLHIAIEKGHKEIVELLIAKGADVNAKDNREATALHLAAKNGRKETAVLLIANGADVNAKDKQKKTPLALAIEKDNKEIIDLLKKHGAVE